MIKKLLLLLQAILLLSLFITLIDVFSIHFELLSTGWHVADYLHYAGKSILMDSTFLFLVTVIFSLVFYILARLTKIAFFQNHIMRKGLSFSFAALVIALIISPINYAFLPYVLSSVSITLNILLVACIIPLSLLFYHVSGRFTGSSGKWKRIGSWSAIGLALLLSIASFVCAKNSDISDKARAFSANNDYRPNIIIITIDALRADHLSCYGYKKIRTQNIDRFAEDGTLFRHTYAPSCWTIPSMMSMLTGKYPTVHGCFDFSHAVSKDLVSIAEILKLQGYRTEAIISTAVLSSKYGFSRGFDRYLEYGDLERIKTFEDTRFYLFLKRMSSHFLIRLERFIPDTTQWTTRHFKNFLNGNPREPFFLWVHYLDPHSPYRPPREYIPDAYESPEKSWEYVQKTKHGDKYKRKDRRSMMNLYDGEILYVDDQLGEIFSLAKEKKIYDDALILVTADHGEAFYEHGIQGHSKTLYQEELRIPFILKLPRKYKASLPKSLIRIPFSLIYLPRIILDLIEVKGYEDFSHINILEIFKGEYHPEGYLFTELVRSVPYLKKIQEKDFALIYNYRTNQKELYHVWKDRREFTDISNQFPEKTEELSTELNRWKKEQEAEKERYAEGKAIGMDRETLKQLRALGYLE